MPFYKSCSCGETVLSEKRSGFPQRCPNCGRSLFVFETKEGLPSSTGTYEDSNKLEESQKVKKRAWTMVAEDDDSIVIQFVHAEGIIGRTAEGKEQLNQFPSVSRNHCKYVKKENGDLIIEDISQFGTFLDGEKLIRGQTYSVRNGSKVGLCNIVFVVMEVTE